MQSLFPQIQTKAEAARAADAFAEKLVPDDPARVSPDWAAFARTLVRETVLQLFRNDSATPREFMRLFTAAPAAELYSLLVGTPAEPIVASQVFPAIREIVRKHLEGLGD